MLHNYHTHTFRCKHAVGKDREYVENAIKRGLKTLGFSDHSPFFRGYDTLDGFRMSEEDMFEYAESVRSLQKEYAKDIRILLGFEHEYYPDYHKEKMEFLNRVNPDYLLLGQHFIGNESAGVGSAGQPNEDFALVAYVNQVISGMNTGDFLYIAHPDVAGFRYTDEAIDREYRRLCLAAKRRNMPLEINFVGIWGNRHYPNERFFKIAGEVGNDVILGIDAHDPNWILSEDAEKQALKMVDKFNLNLVEKLI